MEYYVYALLDPRKRHPDFGFQPFYIGKGKGDRADKHLSVPNFEIESSPKKVYKINSIRKCGYEPKLIKITELLEEDKAYDLESELIKKYGRADIDDGGILTNLCIGSRPPSRKGSKISEKQKQSIIDANRKRLTGKTYEELYGEERAKIVRENVGRATKRRASNITQEHRDKLSKSNSRSYIEIYGSPEEAERQAKIRSESRKGKIRTPEQRRRMSEGSKLRGKPAHNAKKIFIDGQEFTSIKNACEAMGIPQSTLYFIIKRNKIENNIINLDAIDIKTYLKNKIKIKLEEYKNAVSNP